MSDVFISYARPDREAASSLAGILQVLGYTVWWDRDLVSGTDFGLVIQQELSLAKAVIVLWSAASVKSGWVRDEASAALVRNVLVPVVLNGTQAPMGFRSLHTIQLDLVQPTQLLRAVRRLIVDPPPPPRPVYPTPRPRLDPVEAVLGLVVALATGFLAWKLLRP